MNIKPVAVIALSGIAAAAYARVSRIECKCPDDHNKASENTASGFTLLSDVIPEAIFDIRYYSAYNFVGERINGYEQPVALLTNEAASALKKVSNYLSDKGYMLKIFDAYRPQKAVDHFVKWAEDVSDTRMKKIFYPDIDKSLLLKEDYIASTSSHSRGSTVDLTLVDMNTGKELDMGSPFDFFGKISHPDFKGVSEKQYSNRMLLREAMTKQNFMPLNEEWWHFTLHNEPFPVTYFTFPVNENMVK